MITIEFSIDNYPSEHDAFFAFKFATLNLDMQQVDYKPEILDELYVSDPKIASRRTFYKKFKITFFNKDDYLTYCLIKD